MTDAVDAQRRAVVARAGERGNELVDMVVATIVEELPDYGRGRSPGELQDIRAGVRRSIELCLAAIADGRGPADDELVALHLTGGQRARQGIAKPVVLQSVKIATRVGRAFLMTCGDVGDDPQALIGAFGQINELLDRLEDDATAALAEGHDEAHGQVLSGGDRGEAVLVDRLVERRFHHDDDVVAHAECVGLSRSLRAHVVVVTALAEGHEKHFRAVAAELRSRACLAVGPLRVTHRPHLPLLVQPADPEAWAQLRPQFAPLGARTGTVVVHDDRPLQLTEVASGYRPILDGLPFLGAASASAGAVSSFILRFNRVLFGGTAPERAELLHDVLRPLSALSEREAAELFETLDALYETGGPAAVLADHLHCHKNTVGNRLRRVRELTGLDPRRPVESLVLETMVRMRRIPGLDSPFLTSTSTPTA